VADLSPGLSGWVAQFGGMPAKATLCASSAADRAFTKSKSDTAASVLVLLELSEEPGLLPACEHDGEDLCNLPFLDVVKELWWGDGVFDLEVIRQSVRWIKDQYLGVMRRNRSTRALGDQPRHVFTSLIWRRRELKQQNRCRTVHRIVCPVAVLAAWPVAHTIFLPDTLNCRQRAMSEESNVLPGGVCDLANLRSVRSADHR
jgi:hypothetical protein